MQYTIFLILAPIAGIIAITSTYISWRRRKVIGYQSLSWLLVCVTGFLFVNIMEFITSTEAATYFWARATYLFVSFLPVLWFSFALEYSGHPYWLARERFWILSLIPLLTLFFIMNPSTLSLMWKSYEFTPTLGHWILLRVKEYGSWFWVFTVYSYLLVLTGVVLIFSNFFRANNLFQQQSYWITLGAVTPLLVNVVYLGRLIPGFTKDFSPVAYTFAGFCFSVGIMRYQLLDLMPIARAMVVDQMSDGVIVVNQNSRVLDINAAAREMLRLSPQVGVGSSIKAIFPLWDRWLALLNRQGLPNGGMEIVRQKDEKFFFYDLRMTLLTNPRTQLEGQLVTISDVTARKQAEHALKKAHDELELRVRERTLELATLNATLEQRVAERTRTLQVLFEVSAVASQALNVDAMADQAIEKIKEVITCDAGYLFLMDDGPDQAEGAHYRAAGKNSDAPRLTDLPVTHPVAQAIQETREVLTVADTSKVPEFAAMYGGGEAKSLLIAPMHTNERMIGWFLLERAAPHVFQPDDEVLMVSITRQIGLAVHRDYLVHQGILSEERTRLGRDLHDSVTQSLYGLVTLSEAGQAMMESGLTEKVNHTFVRIGQTARHALKEIRLFLYELKPPDLESEGLLGAIQMRLTAVEGRSNIQTRLIADRNLELSPRMTAALYYIIREALNNVLKHTQATQVEVTLNAKGQNVILEVADNGCGFDLLSEKNQGMGLENMQARAEKLGGVFEISTAPGAGVHIKVVVPVATSKKKVNQ